MSILERPTQFDVPLWSCMARRKRLMPIVWYRGGEDRFVDPEMGTSITWGKQAGTNFQYEFIDRDSVLSRLSTLQPTPVAIIAEGWMNLHTWRVGFNSWMRRIPVILPSDRINDPHERHARRLARHLMRRATNGMFAGHITPGSLGVAALQSDGVSQDSIARSLYPIDVALFRQRLHEQGARSRAIRSRWPADAKVVVAVTKLSEREAPLLALEVFERARRSEPALKLLFVGEGPLRPQLESRIRELGRDDDVFLAGYVEYPALPAYYGAADVFLHVAKFEPWGISVSEAMASGLPVLTTANIGSSRDLVIDGKTGRVALSRDADELAAKLLDVFSFAGTSETRAEVAKSVLRVDVEHAAAELEALVGRISLSRRST